MKKKLSPKLKKFLDFINQFILIHDQSPSYEEIMQNLGFGSLGTVNWYVKTLEDQGYLHRVKGPNGKRALIVAQQELSATTTACLPLLGLIAAGEPIEALENPEMVDVPPSLLHPNNYVLQVKGDSMIDEHIHDGDYIVAKKRRQLVLDKLLSLLSMVKLHSNAMYLKKIVSNCTPEIQIFR